MNLNQFFKDHPYITQSGVASKAGISYQALRLEIAGKYSSPQCLARIEETIHTIAKELLQVKIDKTISE